MNDTAMPGTRPAIELAALLRAAKRVTVDEYLETATLASLFGDLVAVANEPRLDPLTLLTVEDYCGSNSVGVVVGGWFDHIPVPQQLFSRPGINNDQGFVEDGLLTLMWHNDAAIIGLAIEHPELKLFRCAWMQIKPKKGSAQQGEAMTKYVAIAKAAVIDRNDQLMKLLKKRLDIADD